MKGLLSVRCIRALLRLLDGEPISYADADILFDAFLVVEMERVISAASHHVLGSDHRGRNAQLRAALMEMLREHMLARRQAA